MPSPHRGFSLNKTADKRLVVMYVSVQQKTKAAVDTLADEGCVSSASAFVRSAIREKLQADYAIIIAKGDYE